MSDDNEREETAGSQERVTASGMAEFFRLMREELVEQQQRIREEQAQQQSMMQLQMDALREVLERSTRDRSDDRSRAAGRKQIKLTRLTETDDVEAYLTTFERLMAIGGIDEDSWAIRLVPQLTGKAQQAYAAMSREDADSYRKVKEAVLRRYNICAETYRHRFRTTRKKEGEAFVELATRLQDLARKWLSECESAEEAIERIVVEQLVNTLPSDLRIWLSERKPVTSVEAGKLADDYAQARRQVRRTPSDQKEDGGGGGPDKRKCHKCGGEGHFKCESAEEAIERIVVEQLVNTLPSDLRIWLSERKPVTSVDAGKLADDFAQARRQVRRTPSDQKEDGGDGGPDKRKCHKCGGEGHFKRNCPVKDEPGADRAGASPGRNRTDKGIKGFNCHRYGHMSMNCPDKANFYCGNRLGRSVVRVGKVEGAVVSELVLDTGCSKTMVRRDLVPEENLLPGEAVTVLCAHGDAMLYPLAYVDMEMEGMQLRTKAVIAKELPVSSEYRHPQKWAPRMPIFT